MTKAYSMRLPDNLLADAKVAAARAGLSFTEYVAGALIMRMECPPSLLDQPMIPVLAPRETCAHPFRDEANACKVCLVQL